MLLSKMETKLGHIILFLVFKTCFRLQFYPSHAESIFGTVYLFLANQILDNIYVSLHVKKFIS